MPVKITLVKGADLAPGVFLQRWQYNHSEIAAVKRAAKLAANNHARLHTLSINGIAYGFVTVGHLRKQLIVELDRRLASEYLMGHVITQALETCQFIPINSIVLETASDKLFPLYESLGFSRLPDLPDWMSLPLPH